ncbi:MAG: GNAT family N-acetyltransferase [Ignavibacteriae bacterium]|nr:GNAT family N-acetyltransferase [Ignavibacteriota bacterium]
MDLNLSNINEINLFDLYDYYAENSDAGKFSSDSLKWVNSMKFPWPNFIYNLSDENLISSHDVIGLIEKHRKNLAPAFWIIRESEILDKLEEIFYENNIRPVEVWPGMVIELDKLNIEKYSRLEGLDIRLVKTDDELKCWLKIVGSELFNGSLLDENFFVKEINKEKIKLYLGFYNGEPVATSMSFFNNESVGLYMIATLPEFRGKGIGACITAKPLIDAIDQGYSIGILQSSKMGESVYRKIGFEQCCRFYIFWTAEIK